MGKSMNQTSDQLKKAEVGLDTSLPSFLDTLNVERRSLLGGLQRLFPHWRHCSPVVSGGVYSEAVFGRRWPAVAGRSF